MTETIAESQSLRLDRYVTIVRRRRWVVILGTLLGLAGAVAYLQLVAQTTTATSLVNVSVISSEPFSAQRSESDLLDAQTEEQSARSSTVLGEAADKLGGDTTALGMRSAMDASLLENGSVMRITYSSTSPARAKAGADAIADAYLDYRSTEADRRRDAIASQLNTRRDELRDDIRKANGVIASASPGTPARAKAEADLQVLTAEVDSLATQLNSLSGLDTSGGAVLSSADDNPTYTAPRRWLVLATGLGAGFALGLVAAFVLNLLDRRIRDEYDVHGAGAGRVFATLGRQGRIPAEGSDRDAFAAARERLLAEFDPAGGVLAVIDLTHRSAPSDLGVNLALALAESHTPVDLMLPAWPPKSVESLLKALDVEVPEPLHGALPVPGRGVRILVGSESEGGESSWLTSLRDAAADSDPDRCLVIAVPPKSSRALRLFAGRISGLTLFAAEVLTTHIGDLARQATEMQAVHTRVGGTLLAGHRRTTKYAAPPAEGDEEGDHDAGHGQHELAPPGS